MKGKIDFRNSECVCTNIYKHVYCIIDFVCTKKCATMNFNAHSYRKEFAICDILYGYLSNYHKNRRESQTQYSSMWQFVKLQQEFAKIACLILTEQ